MDKFSFFLHTLFRYFVSVFLMEVDTLNYWHGIVSYEMDWCHEGNDMRWMVGYVNEGNLYMELWMQFFD